MGSLLQHHFSTAGNPIDLVEQIANSHDWSFERAVDEELTLAVEGNWCDYHISLNWRQELEALHMACAFDLKVPDSRLSEVYRLIAKINEQMWIGHFDLWSSEGLIMFRQGLMLNNTQPSEEQCEALLQAALESCERYYQAFQYVIWAGKTAPDAMASVMFETQGRA